jgi:hypothetical protein
MRLVAAWLPKLTTVCLIMAHEIWHVFPYLLQQFSWENDSRNWASFGPVVITHQLWSHSVVSHHFMQLEGSLLHSQELSTCSYPEPDQSSPHPTSPRSILILSTHLHLGLPSCFFPSGFPTNNLYVWGTNWTVSSTTSSQYLAVNCEPTV